MNDKGILPNHIRVNGMDYDVSEKKLRCSAEVDRTANTIKVNGAMSNQNKVMSLMHEIQHLINWELKETEIEFLAQAWFSILRENKGILYAFIKLLDEGNDDDRL